MAEVGNPHVIRFVIQSSNGAVESLTADVSWPVTLADMQTEPQKTVEIWSTMT